MRLLRDKTPRKDGIVASLDSQLTPRAICGDRPCRDPAPVVIPENSPVGTYGDKSDRGDPRLFIIPEDFNRGSRGKSMDSRLQSARMTKTPRDGSAINPVLEYSYPVAVGNRK
jgi:hypothetical protein